MSESFVSAVERDGKPNKARRDGYVTGVIYARGLETKDVQMKLKDIRPYLVEGKNTKVQIQYEDEELNCIIKEIQYDFLRNRVLNVDLQIVREDEYLKVNVPIEFLGKNMLETSQMLLQIFQSEISLLVRADRIPDSIGISVADRQLGDNILISDIRIRDDIKVLSDLDEIIAVVTSNKNESSSDDDLVG